MNVVSSLMQVAGKVIGANIPRYVESLAFVILGENSAVWRLPTKTGLELG